MPHDFLVTLFVTSRNVLFGVFLPRKIITISQKRRRKFQTSGTERNVLLSVSVLECFGKIF